jgi:hypothetical protein
MKSRMMTLTEAARRSEENNWTEPLTWCDGDWGPLRDLRECWEIGREIGRIIRAYRADGKPFDEQVAVLRDVKKMCSKRLMAWQPTPQQRERAN